jgi:Predicted xylanase/chitin deacetylase
MAKYFTVSWDDGLEQDKIIIQLMKQYGIQGTFNLNSSLLGKADYVKRMGNLGFRDTERRERFLFWNGVEHFRIPKDEISEVYRGFEIASHGCTHQTMTLLSEDEMRREVEQDIAELSRITGGQIVGFAYPAGASNHTLRSVLKQAGIQYARTVSSVDSFEMQAGSLALKPTCSFTSKKKLKLLNDFIEAEDNGRDLVFYMWGHGYELDYGSPECSRQVLERMFGLISSAPNIRFVQNREIFATNCLS